MPNKIVNRYMLILQRTHGGQDALQFDKDGVGYLVPIEPLTDKKSKYQTKKERTITKNTLAFFDAITNRFKGFDQFLSVIGTEIYPFDYKATTSFVAFLNNGAVQQMRLSFDDPILAHVAEVADGSYINKKDQTTIHQVSKLVDMIEDPDCDFVTELQKCFDSNLKDFHLAGAFVDSIVAYHNAIRVKNNNNQNGSTQNDSLTEDLEAFKIDFVDKIARYKNFRELYRFSKRYEHIKSEAFFKEEYQKMVAPKVQEKKPSFVEQFEEARQKSYVKRKEPRDDNQLSLFDN